MAAWRSRVMQVGRVTGITHPSYAGCPFSELCSVPIVKPKCGTGSAGAGVGHITGIDAWPHDAAELCNMLVV
eukprot:9588824-Karenia_brevis.AAC.1